MKSQFIKALLRVIIVSLSIMGFNDLYAQEPHNTNETVNIIGKKYRCKLDVKDIWNAAAQENEEVKKSEKELPPEKRELMDKFLDAMDCYMYITVKNEQKLSFRLKISINTEKAKSLGINAVQRATIGSLFKMAGGTETSKYIRKGAFIYDADDLNGPPIEIIENGNGLKMKNEEFKKTIILKEFK